MMGDDYKGELLAFCRLHLLDEPLFPSQQLLSDEWECHCTVQVPTKYIDNPALKDGHDSDDVRIFTTRATKQKKKESHVAAAGEMLCKLRRVCSSHMLEMKFQRHLKNLVSYMQGQ